MHFSVSDHWAVQLCLAYPPCTVNFYCFYCNAFCFFLLTDPVTCLHYAHKHVATLDFHLNKPLQQPGVTDVMHHNIVPAQDAPSQSSLIVAEKYTC